MLNLLQHLSGVATLTRRFVDAVAGTRAAIVDTRKTIPGLRLLEKHAVRMGGGVNHRFGLDDGILIKDNHIKAAGGIIKALPLLGDAPFLVVNGDLNDLRLYSEEQTRTKIEAFVEQLAEV